MIHHTFKTTVHNVSLEALWQTWSNVNNWSKWQDDIEYAKLLSAFETGGRFLFKPKGGPKLTIGLSYVSPYRSFTDVTHFIGARLLGTHEFICVDDGIEIVVSLYLDGMLAKLWYQLVVKDIVAGLEKQTQALVAYAKNSA